MSADKDWEDWAKHACFDWPKGVMWQHTKELREKLDSCYDDLAHEWGEAQCKDIKAVLDKRPSDYEVKDD